MARKKTKDIFADNTQNTDATQAATPPVEKETRRQRKKRQANMTLEEMTAETDKQLFGDKLEPNLSKNSVPDVVPEGEPLEKRYKTVIEADPYGGREVKRTEEQGTAITNAINNTSVTTGGALYNKALAENPNMTFQEIQELTDKLATADKEKENVETEADYVIGEKVNEAISDIEGEEGGAGEGDGAVEGDGDMGQGGGGAGAPTPNAQSNALMNIGGGGDGTQGPPDYESETNVNKVKRDIAEANKLAAGKDAYVPQAVVERLGVQDYFPTMGQDIAKGTWTGSVLGSQTIYAGGGMVLPMGLYDARKRALNEAAKEKQATIDKLLELPNTADQFNTRYQDYGYEFINSNLNKFGSYSAMAADPEFKRKMAEFKNIGKELMYVDKWADEKIKDLGNPEKYVPKEIIEDLYKFKSGIMENLDEALDGKGDIPQMINNLRSFESGIAMVDNLVKEGIFDENRLDEAPISLNTGAINADPEGWGKFQSDMLKVVNNDGSIDNDTYVTGLMKFFDTSKAENIINGLFQGNLDGRTRESVLKYLLSQAPKKVVYDYQSMGNQLARRAADAMENSRFYAGLAERRRERETPYQYLRRQVDTPDEHGLTLRQRLDWIRKNESDPKKRAVLVKRAMGRYNIGAPGYDASTGAFTFDRAPSKELSSKVFATNAETDMIAIKVWDPKLKRHVDKSMTVAQVRNINTNNLKLPDGTPRYKFPGYGGVVTKDDIASLRSSNLTQNVTSLQGGITFRNKNTGQWETLTDKNYSQFNPNESGQVERYVGNIQYLDAKGNPVNTKWRVSKAYDAQHNPALDAQFGSTGQNLKGEFESNSSSSSYSGGSR